MSCQPRVQASGGISLIDCVIDVPPNYGVYTTGNAPSAVAGCTFNSDARSGHTVVMQLTNGGASTLRVEDNRMHHTGVDYLATGYRTLVPTSYRAANTWRYGIYAYGSNNPTGSVTIRNNIISDKYVGIYGTSSSSGPRATWMGGVSDRPSTSSEATCTSTSRCATPAPTARVRSLPTPTSTR